MTQETERLVEPIALTILTERLGAEAASRCKEGDSTAWKDAKRYARAVLQSDALTALIKREGELRALLHDCRWYVRESLAVRIDAALNPNTESE